MAEPTRRDLAAERRGKGGTKPIRHARKTHSGRAGHVVSLVAAALVVALVSVVGVGGYAVAGIFKSIDDNKITIGAGKPFKVPDFVGGEYPGAFNMLVIGVDNDPDQPTGPFGDRSGTLNDVNILIHIAADHKSGTVVSIPRDLIIPHPSCTDPKTGAVYGAMSAQPMNVAFSRGGLSCVVDTVENLTGLKIPFAAQMTFEAVEKMTDAVGGVEVCLANDINDDHSRLHLTAGKHVIKGATALAFLRTRHGAGDGSDLTRISLQQSYMASLVRTMTSSGTLSDPTKLYALAQAAADTVKLSDSLASLDTMVAMARTLKSVDLTNLTFVQYPGTTGNAAYPGKVVPITATATQLFDAIKSDTPVKAGRLGNGTKTDADATNSPTSPSTSTATAPPTSSATGTPDPEQTAITIDTPGQGTEDQTCARGFLQ